MRVEKIDIHKQLMDLPEGSDRFVCMEFPKIDSFVHPNGRIEFTQPDSATKIKTYHVVERHNKLQGQVRRYLVEVDERGIYNDLSQIADITLNNFIQYRENVLKTEAASKLQAELFHQKGAIISAIKALPWWKRLFNKF